MPLCEKCEFALVGGRGWFGKKRGREEEISALREEISNLEKQISSQTVDRVDKKEKKDKISAALNATHAEWLKNQEDRALKWNMGQQEAEEERAIGDLNRAEGILARSQKELEDKKARLSVLLIKSM